MIATTEKLALALEKIAAPGEMIRAARAGRYDVFKSESTTPIRDLVFELRRIGAHALVQRAINGHFDATKEEAEAWHREQGWKEEA
jgi:hypothetical protein